MSKTSAYMPWFIGDYLRDTAHLEAHEHGAYMLMIAHAWQHEGQLPLDEERIRKIGKLTIEQWRNSRETLMEFWHKSETSYHQRRVGVELEKAENLYRQRVEAGLASAAKRSSNARSTLVQRSFNESESESPSQPHSDSQSQRPKITKVQKANGVELPEWLPRPQWEGYIEMRKKIRKPMTDRAQRIAISKLANLMEQGQNPIGVLSQSIFNSWQGLFPVKQGENQ